MKKIFLSLLLITLSLSLVSAATKIFDFENCNDLSSCDLVEETVNIGANMTYPTTFGNDRVLYYNGQRLAGPPYTAYVLSFENLPFNATTLEYDVYPVDASYSEFTIRYLATGLGFTNPYQGIYLYNSDFNNYATLSYDFNGDEINISCPIYPVGQWTRVKINISYVTQKINVYHNDVFKCNIDWSAEAANVGNLGSLSSLSTVSGDTPNVYLDNITFTSVGVAPTILSRYPASDPEITYGESQVFNITVYEPDNDSLSYEWLVNGVDQNNDASTFLFDSTSYSAPTIIVTVIDGDGNDSVTWNPTVTAAPLGNYVPSYTDEDVAPIAVDGISRFLVVIVSLATVLGLLSLYFLARKNGVIAKRS